MILSTIAQWSSSGGPLPKPVRSEFRYSIATTLIAAADEESAYEKASSAAAGDIDTNLDGPGHPNFYYTLGLHELAEYPFAEHSSGDPKTRNRATPSIDPNDGWISHIPRIRQKEELEVFRDKVF